MLATFNWTGGNGNFNDPTMWTGPNGIKAVPGPGDDADTPSGVTISITGNTTVNSYTGPAMLDIVSGTFDVTNSINLPNSNIGNLNVGAGATFTTSAETTTLTGSGVIAGTLNVPTGATLIFNGSVNGINLTAGSSLTGAGTFDVHAGLMLQTPTTSPTNLILDSANADGIDGPGTLTVPSGATLDFRSGSMEGVGDSTIIQSGATLLIDSTVGKTVQDRALVNQGTATWTGTGTFVINGDAVFTNSNTFAIQNDALIQGSGVFDNTGTVTKTSPSGTGTTDIGVTYNNSGKTVAQSGILQLDNDGTDTGEFNIPGSSGSINITGKGYSLNPGASVTGPGTLHLGTGFLGEAVVNLNTNLTIQNVAIDDGELLGPDSLTVPGALSMNIGDVAITGTLNLPVGSTLTMAGSGGQLANFDNVTVNAAGAATLSGTEQFGLSGSAVFNNSGSFAIEDDTVANVGGNIDLGTATFNNTGSLTKTSPAGLSGTSFIRNGIFFNRGKVSVVSGQLNLQTNGTSTGNFDASQGATLLLMSTWNLNAGTTFTDTGSFGNGVTASGAGTINVNASVSATNFMIPGGVVNVSPAASTFSVTNLNWSNGAIEGTGTVAIPSGGTVSFTGSSDKQLETSTLSISGVANWSGTGNIDLSTGAVIFVQAGGTFNASNDQTINGQTTEAFNVAGTFTKTSLTGVGTTKIDAPTNLLPGGTIHLATGNLSTPSLTNVGTITLASQTVLTVNGVYTQPIAGTLNIAVGGAPNTALFGQVNVTSTGFLVGTLNAGLVNGFTPTVGQVFPIMTFASRVGNFANFNSPISAGKPVFSTSLQPNAVNLVTATAIVLPSAPTGLAIFPADDTGGPGVTANHEPRLTGQAAPGILVQIYLKQQLIASAVTGANGTFVAPLTSPLATGQYSFVAVAIDQYNNYSPNSAPFAVTITPPATPTGLAIFPADDTGGPGITAIHQPRLTGQATPGILVQVYNTSRQLVASAVAGANGTFVAPMLKALAPGQYNFVAVAIDQFGNFSVSSSSLGVTITQPAAPTGLAIFAADDTGGPGVTTDHQPRLTGQATPGILIQIYLNNQFVGTAMTGTNGTFVAPLTSPLPTGHYSFVAVAIDQYGNYSPNSTPLAVTITPPATPTGLAIFAADDTGGPGVTAIHQPRLTGQATPGILVQVYNTSRQLVASAVAGANGTFVAPMLKALAPGQYNFVAVAIDQFGNFSVSGTTLNVTITPPPAAPTGLTLLPADDNRGPGVTTLLQPRLTGKAQAGLLVQILDTSNNFIGFAVADSTGTFVITPLEPFSIGVHVLKAVAVDAGNNVGAFSATYTLTIA